MKNKSILLTLLVWSVVAVFFVISRIGNNPIDSTTKTVQAAEINPVITKPINKELKPAANPVNPQIVPDRIAYLMVLRLLSSYKDEMERKRLRSYVKQVLGITDDNEIEAVFQLASDFKQRVLPVDNQINSIKDRYHPTHPPFSNDDRKKLDKLKKDKDKIVDDLIRDLPNRLTPNAKDKLHRNIQEKVKGKIKMQD